VGRQWQWHGRQVIPREECSGRQRDAGCWHSAVPPRCCCQARLEEVVLFMNYSGYS